MEKTMQGKVALVTGASSGIGKATALAFAERGARVVLSDVLEKEGAALASEMEAAGLTAHFIRCDVSDEEQVRQLIKGVVQTFGRIDYAFNNAGIEGQQNLLAQSSQDNWDRVMAVNLRGVEMCMKYELEEMLRQGGGSIVNTASIAGIVGFPGLSAYVASKHAIVGLTQTAALEYGTKNIRINAVCPGPIATPMLDRLMASQPGMEAQLTSQVPLGRIGKPEEIADAVVWLISDSASYVTGHALPVDGGWTAK